MAEEKDQTPSINNDDIDVLRVLLHNIKGISPVSTTAAYVPIDDEVDA